MTRQESLISVPSMDVAVTVAVPVSTAKILPKLSTVTTSGSEDVHSTVFFVASVGKTSAMSV